MKNLEARPGYMDEYHRIMETGRFQGLATP